MKRGVGLSFVALLLCACPGTPKRSAASAESRLSALPPYDGPLISPSHIPEDFLWQQRVEVSHSQGKATFDAAVQKKGDELLILGLTPFGTRAFSLRQKGQTFEYQQFIPIELPFPKKAILVDIHRAFFVGLSDGASDSRTFEIGEEICSDTYEKGALLRREFRGASGTQGTVQVTFSSPGYLPYHPPDVTVLKNPTYGYELRVLTSSVTRL